jgi:hypothetical protein
MADLDPSIIMGAKPVQINDPLDQAVKAMSLKDLSMRSQNLQLQNQQAQQEFSDNQAMRNATANNTKVDANGNPSIDRAGMLSELGKTSPSLVPKAAMGFAQQDQAVQQQHLATMKTKMETTAQLLSQAHDQTSYDSALQGIKAMNGDTSQLPSQYDPNAVAHASAWAQNASLSAKDQLEQANKQQEMAIKQQGQNIEVQKLRSDLKQKAATQNQETLGALQALRGNPALQRAETNVLSSKNMNDLAEQLRDPKTGQINLNNANPQQISLFSHELLRMASGGSGSESDLENLKPGTPQYKMAELRQKLTGKVSGADAAQYLQQGLDYANTLGKSSNQFLYQNAKHVVDAKRNYLAPQDAQQYDSWLNGLKNGSSFFGDVVPGGQPSAPTVQGNPSHPALQGKSVAELQQMKAALLNGSR